MKLLTACTVLVVDDYDAIRVLLQDVLEMEGFRVLNACDGNDALRVLGEVHPALILLDIKMPGCDGRELLGRLRGDDALAIIPVVLVTADKDAGQVTGIAALIKKPFDVGLLVSTVRRCVGLPA